MSEQTTYNIKTIILIVSEFERISPTKAVSPEEYEKLKRNINIDISFEVIDKSIETILTVQYNSLFDDGGKEVYCKVVMGGSFEIIEGTSSTITAEKFGSINGPAIIYPYIREHLSSLSLKAGIPAILLPPYNFVNHPKKIN